MYVPLKVTTDYSLLKSTIKIDDLISFLNEHHLTSCAICDEYLFGVMEFYTKCQKNNIKPIIGLEITLNHHPIYLYGINYNGYQNLLKLNTLKQERELGIVDLEMYSKNILAILPFSANSLYKELTKIYPELYIGYQNAYEKKNALVLTDKIVFVNNIRSLLQEDVKYLPYLEKIENDQQEISENKKEYSSNYYFENIPEEDAKTTYQIAKKINIVIPKDKNYIPKYSEEIASTYEYLESLTQKGLQKRLKGNVPPKYQERLSYELNVIKNMGFVDYILIVYDYVLYAKKHHVFVGPGRGSAAGSLVCYTLGITDIDPLEYNLLFERFLNPERVTMPDIDIDFENTKRDEVIEYIRNRYGKEKVASIMTFATLKSKLALREVARVLGYTNSDFEELLKNITSTMSLKENLANPKTKELMAKNKELQKIYKIAYRLEGLKKNISTHAAGIVISSTTLDEVIPVIPSPSTMQTGITMEYLEELGLLKMDLLAIKNLTIIANILELIEKDTGKTLNLNTIDLNDPVVLELFTRGDTTGIFQFESTGMRSFLEKLKPRSFSDIVASIALYRPGPMDNIDSFIRRKEGKEKIDYLIPDLEPILKETEGIIVYQEQVMQILVKVANYRFSEADLVRRAMSKKKKDIILQEKEKFITSAVKNGYDKQIAIKIFELILKFANYGFNKSHSVSYALIGYQMAYLKAKFPAYFITNLLNMSMGSVVKTSEYILEAKKHNLKMIKPEINKSQKTYYIENQNVYMPLGTIKGLSTIIIDAILAEREANGRFQDFIDFVKRMYHKNINERILTILIEAGVFLNFGNMNTLKENMASILNYAELASSLDESLVLPPVIKEVEDTSDKNEYELKSFGFYISNHPTSKYMNENIMKLIHMPDNFDKYIRCVVLIESIRRIKTKKNEEMAFIEASDETSKESFVIFAKQMKLIEDLKIKDIVEMQGRVTKRLDKYQINVNNIIKK